MAERVVHHASGTSSYARCGVRLGGKGVRTDRESERVTCGRCRKYLGLRPLEPSACGCKEHPTPKECVGACRCECNADFVRVERWECRVGCGDLIRKEDVGNHGCAEPDASGATEVDPVCENCGELRSAHTPNAHKALAPVCRRTPFHLVHFRAAEIIRTPNTRWPSPTGQSDG